MVTQNDNTTWRNLAIDKPITRWLTTWRFGRTGLSLLCASKREFCPRFSSRGRRADPWVDLGRSKPRPYTRDIKGEAPG
jgi:hypothetical protein